MTACVVRRLGHNTAHFNVGNYRRLQKEANEVQDASFFDSHNKVGCRLYASEPAVQAVC
jgi:6-phosphofructo-2-kinase/fructose-2,6-biphosphatase